MVRKGDGGGSVWGDVPACHIHYIKFFMIQREFERSLIYTLMNG